MYEVKAGSVVANTSEILRILANNGPDESEYQLFDNIINQVDNEKEGQMFRELMSPILEKESIFGHTFQKPYGYAGDYFLIEKIYQLHESDDPAIKKWDRFYHSHEACVAVINRKTYFLNKLEELHQRNKEARVLILGSGPATDVFEFNSSQEEAGIENSLRFDLLDIDQGALDYAAKKNERYVDNIEFVRTNVMKYSTDEKYDLIWSAGLFDYLNDKYFTVLLAQFQDNLREEGQIIVGNFSPSNPTKRIMEVMGDWILNYRDEEHLISLAEKAGIVASRCTVEKEPLGINLFLKINKA